MRLLSIGMIGYGAVGSGVADAIHAGKAGPTKLAAVLGRDPGKITPRIIAKHGFRTTTELQDFLHDDIELVVEAAGVQALRQYAESILMAGKDLMVLSVSAFADEQFFTRVRRVAQECGRRVFVPSGAIAGLDAISAAALSDIEEVVHTIRKHPRSFSLPQREGPLSEGPTLLFDGPARIGVLQFPENANVAAAVSLAGVGLDRTRLRVIADPAISLNTHEIEVRGRFGQLKLLIQNVPSENPKTSRLVPLSVAKALRNLSECVIIGA